MYVKITGGSIDKIEFVHFIEVSDMDSAVAQALFDKYLFHTAYAIPREVSRQTYLAGMEGLINEND